MVNQDAAEITVTMHCNEACGNLDPKTAATWGYVDDVPRWKKLNQA